MTIAPPTEDTKTLPLPSVASTVSQMVPIFTKIEDVSTDSFPNNRVISLFSGAGGMDLGLEMAGFHTDVCVEIDDDCRATMLHNRPEWKQCLGTNMFEQGDIRTISGAEIMRVGNLVQGEAALVVGGPPCQSFSNIGKRDGVENSVNGDLYQHYVRVVKECLPQGFLFENVEGFTQDKHREALDYIMAKLGGQYAITYAVLNSADYGVPQQRKRFILFGIRKQRRVKPALPFPTHFQNEATQDAWHCRLGTQPSLEYSPLAHGGRSFCEHSAFFKGSVGLCADEHFAGRAGPHGADTSGSEL